MTSSAAAKTETTAPFETAGFFVLRTPTLAFDEFVRWADGPDPASFLAGLARRPEIADALYIASPSLSEALADAGSERARRALPALVSYFARMTGRATPFGLFAGTTLGTTAATTELALTAPEAWRRHTRLDMDYLFSLSAALEADPSTRDSLTWRPNSSLSLTGGRLHYAEARLTGTVRAYHLVAVEEGSELTRLLEAAAEGATLPALAACLVDDELTFDDAAEFVAAVAEAQLLVSDAQPQVTGDEPVGPLITGLATEAATAPVAGALDRVRAALESIDASGLGVDPDRYRAAQALLDPLPVSLEPARLFQVDLDKPAPVTLGPGPLTELARAVEILHRLAPPPAVDARLARFAARFTERYEEGEIPLGEALDEELGVGFETGPADGGSPLVAGLPFPVEPAGEASFSARDGFLLSKLTTALIGGGPNAVVDIEPGDLEGLPSPPRPLPDTIEVMAELAASSTEAVDRGDYHLLVTSVGGAPGARLMGRFCHANPDLASRVRDHLRAEEAHRPDAVFAEIVHLNEGRHGNILCRPLLRDYEIPYLGRSGAAPDRQLPLSDLLVSVRRGRIVLRSRRLDQEVIPRLTTAHNYSHNALGVYRFLCDLQGQDTTPGVAWSWGPLDAAPFLPRVTSGRLVLARARWRLTGPALTQVSTMREEGRLPRFVVLADGDNELVCDLDNPLSATVLTQSLKNRSQMILLELYPGPDDLCVTGAGGRFVHELVVPFLRPPVTAPALADASPVPAIRLTRTRRHPPGSDWLYAKLYTGSATTDRVLIDMIRPLVAKTLGAGLADSWFFLRYGDPEWHIRVRLRGDARALVPLLHEATAGAVADGTIWRIQLDTYQPEMARYGGPEGVGPSEQLFRHDSDAVLEILSHLGDAGPDVRWRLALVGIDRLLADFGFDLAERHTWSAVQRDGFAREFRVDGAVKAELGKRYRAERAGLDALLTGNDEAHPLAAALEPLRARSEAIRPIARQIGARNLDVRDLTASYAHMHANRLLRSGHRVQEMAIYDFLHRHYQSKVARQHQERRP